MYWLYVGLHQTIAPLCTLHPLHKGCESLRVWTERRPPGNSINRGKAHAEPVKASPRREQLRRPLRLPRSQGLAAQDTSSLLPLPKATSVQRHQLEQHPKGSSCCRQAEMTGLYIYISIYIYLSLSKEETLRDFQCNPLLRSKQLGSVASPVLQPPMQPQSQRLAYGT